jgi:hypothetical protein
MSSLILQKKIQLYDYSFGSFCLHQIKVDEDSIDKSNTSKEKSKTFFHLLLKSRFLINPIYQADEGQLFGPFLLDKLKFSDLLEIDIKSLSETLNKVIESTIVKDSREQVIDNTVFRDTAKMILAMSNLNNASCYKLSLEDANGCVWGLNPYYFFYSFFVFGTDQISIIQLFSD